MQLALPPTARGFLIPWSLNTYALAVLQQQIMAFLEKKGSTFCGIQVVERPPCTEVYIYATVWDDGWKKDVQELCYKATATGSLPGMGMGMMGMGMEMGCGGYPSLPTPTKGKGGSATPCMMGSMPMGMGMGMGVGMGMGMGYGLGPACPPMMHGAPVNYANRPLPSVGAKPAFTSDRPLPKI